MDVVKQMKEKPTPSLPVFQKVQQFLNLTNKRATKPFPSNHQSLEHLKRNQKR